jgi:hypothetical protein
MKTPLETMRKAAIDAPRWSRLWREDTVLVDRPDWYEISTPSAPTTYLNEICFSELEPDRCDEVIDEVVRRRRAEGRPVKWCVGPWTKPDDFGDRLARRGFEAWGVSGMAITSDARVATPPDVEAFEVDDDDSLARWIDVSMRGWSLPDDQSPLELAACRAARVATPRLVHFFAARDAKTKEWLGTSAVFIADGGAYGYLVGAQVLESARGRGLYKTLVAARLAFLRARNIPFAVTQARDSTSAPILERLGFETVFRSKCYVLTC